MGYVPKQEWIVRDSSLWVIALYQCRSTPSIAGDAKWQLIVGRTPISRRGQLMLEPQVIWCRRRLLPIVIGAATSPAGSASGFTPFLLHLICDISHCRKRFSPGLCSRHNQTRGRVPQLRIQRPKRPRPVAQFGTPAAAFRSRFACSFLCH
jgi:hypothetical protein